MTKKKKKSTRKQRQEAREGEMRKETQSQCLHRSEKAKEQAAAVKRGRGLWRRHPRSIGAGGAFGGAPPPINAPPTAILDTGKTDDDAPMAGAQ